MAALINKIIGHEKVKAQTLLMLEETKMPGAMIFHGPQGVGKKTLVQALLQVANCKVASLACGECSHCLRSLEEKNELIYHLQPETKKSISVDQVRELHKQLSLKSLHGARFVIIDPADRLSIAAANSLLKVLEEAPPKTHFFLITDRVSSLLATIRSRAQSFHFSKLTNQELGQVGQFDKMAIEWSDGRVAMAEQLSDPESVDQLNESLKFLYSLTCEAPQDWKKRAPWFFSDDQARSFSFNIWNQALEKRLHQKGDNLDWLPEGAEPISFLFDQLEGLKKDINANVEKQLAVENFYYQLRSQA